MKPKRPNSCQMELAIEPAWTQLAHALFNTQEFIHYS